MNVDGRSSKGRKKRWMAYMKNDIRIKDLCPKLIYFKPLFVFLFSLFEVNPISMLMSIHISIFYLRPYIISNNSDVDTLLAHSNTKD
jgi:hypothetical protein